MHCCNWNLRLLRHFTKSVAKSQRYTTPAVQTITENSSLKNIPEDKIDELESEIDFPPIQDLTRDARNRRKREEWHDKVKKLGTVEEKIFELNMPRYYGWKTVIIKEETIPYDPLSHTQYVTRTHVMNEPGLPDCYNNIVSPETLDSLVQAVKTPVEDALLFEYNFKR